MRAIITLINGDRETFEKLTEIHYGYDRGYIAFENDTEQTGFTKNLNEIAEIEVFND